MRSPHPCSRHPTHSPIWSWYWPTLPAAQSVGLVQPRHPLQTAARRRPLETGTATESDALEEDDVAALEDPEVKADVASNPGIEGGGEQCWSGSMGSMELSGWSGVAARDDGEGNGDASVIDGGEAGRQTGVSVTSATLLADDSVRSRETYARQKSYPQPKNPLLKDWWAHLQLKQHLQQ